MQNSICTPGSFSKMFIKELLHCVVDHSEKTLVGGCYHLWSTFMYICVHLIYLEDSLYKSNAIPDI